MLNLEVFDRAFSTLFDEDAGLTLLGNQFLFTEGPIWDPEEKSLTFSDIADSKMWRWTERTGFTVLRTDTNKANGNAYDLEGRIVTCEHAKSRLIRTKSDGSDYEVLVERYEGRELNAPNDVVVKRDGVIYFSDPWFGRKPTWIGVGRELDLDFQGVFSFDPESETLRLLSKNFTSPNGLCFSEHEDQLYVADTPEHKIYVFDVAADGTLAHQRLFADTAFEGGGGPDGLKIDSAGRIFCAAQGGLHVYSSEGKRLGVVRAPQVIANFCFGGEDGKTVFLTAQSDIYTLRLR